MSTLTASTEPTITDEDVTPPNRSLWSRPGVKIGACALVLVMAIAASWFLATSTATAPTRDTLAGTPAAGAPVGQKLLADSKAGYQLSYPAAWTEVTNEVGTEAGTSGHVIRISDKNAFSIRTFPLQQAISAANVSDMRAVTDAILSDPDAKLTVLDVRQIEVAGLPTVYYLYYFPNGNQRGIHAHYFVFDGKKMHALVFQVVPADSFDQYASQFDRVLASFKPLAH